MRLVAIDLAHVEGFNRAVEDVSLRRLVNYGMRPALKTAFEQVFSAPYIVKMLLAELGEDPEHDLIVKLDYDGSLARSEIEIKAPFDVLAGSSKAEEAMLNHLVEHDSNPPRALDDAIRLAAQTWAVGLNALDQKDDTPDEIDPVKFLREQLKSRHVEAAVLDRSRRWPAVFACSTTKKFAAPSRIYEPSPTSGRSRWMNRIVGLETEYGCLVEADRQGGPDAYPIRSRTTSSKSRAWARLICTTGTMEPARQRRFPLKWRPALSRHGPPRVFHAGMSELA